MKLPPAVINTRSTATDTRTWSINQDNITGLWSVTRPNPNHPDIVDHERGFNSLKEAIAFTEKNHPAATEA